MSRRVWQNSHLRPFQFPLDERQVFEEMLRRKLRVIWYRAASGDNPRAAVERLRSGTREFQHICGGAHIGIAAKPDFAGWVIKTNSALEWLERNTPKLRFCGIADCKIPFLSPPHTERHIALTTAERLLRSSVPRGE